MDYNLEVDASTRLWRHTKKGDQWFGSPYGVHWLIGAQAPSGEWITIIHICLSGREGEQIAAEIVKAHNTRLRGHE